MKLDMSKAYDHVEWPYLKEEMKALGFSEWWIQLAFSWITIVNYFIFLNGYPRLKFTHQEDYSKDKEDYSKETHSLPTSSSFVPRGWVRSSTNPNY